MTTPKEATCSIKAMTWMVSQTNYYEAKSYVCIKLINLI